VTEGWDFYASIRPDSERAEHWRWVFEDPERVPITTPVGTIVELPIGRRRVLFVKIKELSEDERERLVRNLAGRFGVAPAEIEASIKQDPDHAVPILDEDVFVTVLHPQKWFSE
jgi:hypothetical protein